MPPAARHSMKLGIGIIAALVFAAIAAPWLAPHNPHLVDAKHAFAAPGWHYPFGTDDLGRDVLSRLLYGARWSLGLVFAATVLVLSIGVSVGVAAGYFGGVVDAVLMRLVDALLAVPSLLLALAIVGIVGPGLMGMMLGLSGIWWAGYARVVRGMVLVIRERSFVDAARALGSSRLRIVWRCILPAIMPAVIVLASLELGELVLAISGLSFLGLGAQPPTPEWGAMLSDARVHFFDAPRLTLLPALAVTTAVFGFNLLGDGLRDILDPGQASKLRAISL